VNIATNDDVNIDMDHAMNIDMDHDINDDVNIVLPGVRRRGPPPLVACGS